MDSKIGYINSNDFNSVIQKLRSFFLQKGLLEIHPQSRLSILAACEDPNTIATFNYAGKVWPLPQTGQMWLEYELLHNPTLPGLFCVTTSFRNEPDPIPGRHDSIFPMFEFEIPGDMEILINLEKELLLFLGFPQIRGDYPQDCYENICCRYGVDVLTHANEKMLQKDFGSVFFLTDFPNHTSPFWNMKQDKNNKAKKVDVIINGIETIGSAERSCNADEMKKQFYTISSGAYATRLFSNFTKERVEKELNDFLSLKFFPRSGAGIGLTRLIKGMKACRLLNLDVL
jgi:aspartyl/asparaginyl-tRNA synthetase